MTEIVVTMVLIVIGLISNVMVAGFAFGLLGSYATSPEVSAQFVGCSSSASGGVCNVLLNNIGARNVDTAGSCIENSRLGSVGSGGTVPAGGTLNVSCTVTGFTIQSGDLVTGSVSLSNGASVYFAGRA